MRIIGALLLGSSLLVTPALAGFQGIEWGVEEHPLFQQNYAAFGYDFMVYAQFSGPSKGLSLVELVPIDIKQCREVGETLLGIYGDSIKSEGGMGHLQQWRDVSNGNLVNYMNSERGCSLIYEPLAQPNQPGGL